MRTVDWFRTSVALVASLTAIVGSTRRGYPDTSPGVREVPKGDIDFTPTVADLAVQSGQYAPRIQLEAPPGPAGQAPDLSVIYAAKRDNGPLGAGWGLAFESTIARKSALGGLPAMTATDSMASS